MRVNQPNPASGADVLDHHVEEQSRFSRAGPAKNILVEGAFLLRKTDPAVAAFCDIAKKDSFAAEIWNIEVVESLDAGIGKRIQVREQDRPGDPRVKADRKSTRLN